MTNKGHALAREELVRTLTAYTGLTTSDGTSDGSSLVDSKLIGVNDYLTGKSVLILSGDALYETIGISSFTPATGEVTFGGTLSTQIVAGVSFRVLNTLPESVHITSGLITMEGYDYVSGEYRRVAVNESGQIEIKATVADIVTAHVSGVVDVLSGAVEITSILSGQVQITSGVVTVESGSFVAARVLSGEIKVEGGDVEVSGVVVVTSGAVEITSILSGQVQVTSGVIAAVVSGTIESVASGIVEIAAILSGQVQVTSGVIAAIVSGTVTAKTSGATVDIAAPTAVRTRDILVVGALSGGVVLLSGDIKAATVKSLSGDIFIGGEAADDMPYSGHGLLLAAGEAWSLDIDNFNRIKAFATVSGDWLSYAGVK